MTDWELYATNVLDQLPVDERASFTDWVLDGDISLHKIYQENPDTIVRMWRIRNMDPDLIMDDGL